MKSILKKLLIIFLIFLTINCFVISNISHANVVEDGLEAIGEGIVGIFAYPVQLLLKIAGSAINWVTAGIAYIDGAEVGTDTSTITPFDILYNKVKLVNVNVFDLSEPDTITGKVRTGIATWYYVLRIIASGILLVILIYVGIRMALTTIASDKAMYNKMLIDWVTSLALIFLLQYIILFTFYVNDALVDVMENVSNNTDVSAAIEEIGKEGFAFGYKGIGASAVYFILVTQTIGLLISYINRMLKVSFLIIISPLITLTYSIDKMGDGKAQALGTWLKEFVFTVLMQPFHCIIYMIMVSTSLNLLTSNLGLSGSAERLGFAIFAIICIRFIQEAEKIIRKIFHFEDDNSGTSVAAGMAMSAMMLSQSKNIGKTLKSGVTTAKNLGTNATNFMRHAKTDAMVIGAVLRGNNTKKVTVNKTDSDGNVITDSNGNVQTEEVDRKMTYAELKDEALAAQINKKADKLANKVDKNGEISKKYTANTKAEDLSEQDQKRYKTLRASGMKHSRAMATLRKEKLDKEKAKYDRDNPTLRTRAISGYKSVRSGLRDLNQLDIIKDFKAIGNNYIATTVGVGVGISMYGNGRDLMQSGMMGAAAFSSTKEFMRDTTKTLIDTATSSITALNAKNPEEVRAIGAEALESNPLRYQDNSDEMKQILDNIKNQLRALGMNENSVNTFSNRMHKQIKKNALEGNGESMSEIMTRNLQEYNNTSEGKNASINLNKDTSLLQDAMMQSSDFENQKIIFDNYQKVNEATGMSAETYLDELVRSCSSNADGLFGQPGSENNSERPVVSEGDLERIKETNDNVDSEDTKEFVQKEIEETVRKVEETAIDRSQMSDMKDEIKTELESRITNEVEKHLEDIHRANEAELKQIMNELLKQQAGYEKAKKALEEEQRRLDNNIDSKTPDEMRDFEKRKIVNEYDLNVSKRMTSYVMNYQNPSINKKKVEE